MANFTKALHRLDRWEWLTVAIAVWAVFAPALLLVVWLGNSFSLDSWAWLVADIPVFAYVLVSLWYVGISSSQRQIVPRDTLLWSWLAFLGSALRGGVLLMVGAVIGTLTALIVGDGSSLGALALAGSLVVYSLGSWLLLAIVVWTARALIDVSGRRLELQENLLEWLQDKKVRHPKQKAKFLEDGASPFFVLVSAVGLLVVVLLSVIWVGDLLAQ